MNISLLRNSNPLNFSSYQWLRNCFSGLEKCGQDARTKDRLRENKIFILDDLKTFFFCEFNLRFDGVAHEPRKGIRSGLERGTKCLPFLEVNILI